MRSCFIFATRAAALRRTGSHSAIRSHDVRHSCVPELRRTWGKLCVRCILRPACASATRESRSRPIATSGTRVHAPRGRVCVYCMRWRARALSLPTDSMNAPSTRAPAVARSRGYGEDAEDGAFAPRASARARIAREVRAGGIARAREPRRRQPRSGKPTRAEPEGVASAGPGPVGAIAGVLSVWAFGVRDARWPSASKPMACRTGPARILSWISRFRDETSASVSGEARPASPTRAG